MKLFMVIYVSGLIGGTIGPLPYDETECERRAVRLMNLCDPTKTAHGRTCADIRFKCERHNSRPVITFNDGKD